ncbi:MAG: hypothetical protein U5R31_15430 [Acidimicrobiia bacterium]|nr:hypothetical protein [Acidimicrobiia bacterium]
MYDAEPRTLVQHATVALQRAALEVHRALGLGDEPLALADDAGLHDLGSSDEEDLSRRDKRGVIDEDALGDLGVNVLLGGERAADGDGLVLAERAAEKRDAPRRRVDAAAPGVVAGFPLDLVAVDLGVLESQLAGRADSGAVLAVTGEPAPG